MTTEPLSNQAPYAPASAVIALIEGYRDKGWAGPFGPDLVVKAGVPESLSRRTVAAMKLLGLTDEAAEPTPAFQEIRRSQTDDQARERFAEQLRSTYAEVFQFADVGSDDLERIEGAFRGFEPAGQRGRMVSLFVGLADWAGLVPEEAPARRALRRGADASVRRGAANTSTRRRRATPLKADELPLQSPPGTQPRVVADVDTGPERLLEHPVQDDLLLAIWKRLPVPGSVWPLQERERWLAAQEAAFALVYTLGDREVPDPPTTGGGG